MQTGGNGLHVVARQATVGRETFREDKQVAAALGPLVIVECQEAADVGHAVLFGAHGAAVGEGKHLLGDRERRLLGVARFALLDEPGVLGVTAGVEEERHAVGPAHVAHGADIGQADRLAAAGVVRDRHHYERNALADVRDGALERLDVHVAFERVQRVRLPALRHGQVAGLGAGGFDVGPRRVEVRVVRHYVAAPAHRAEQNALGRPALMHRQNVLEPRDLVYGPVELVKRRAAGVALIALQHPAPLHRAHGAGA